MAKTKTALEAFREWEEKQEAEKAKMLQAIADEAGPEIERLCQALKEYVSVSRDSVVRELKAHGLWGGSRPQAMEVPRTRISREAIAAAVAEIPVKLKAKRLGRAVLAEALGVNRTSLATVLKAAAEAGLKIGHEGEKRATVYFLK